MKFLILLLLFLPLSGAADDAHDAVFDLSEKRLLPLGGWEIRSGDRPEWAVTTGEDRLWKAIASWKPAPAGDAPGTGGRFWLRTFVTLQGTRDETDPLELYLIRIPSAFEVFWDGRLIARNGRLGGDRLEEDPGKIRRIARLPGGSAGGGRHQISIRVSNFHFPKKTREWAVHLGYGSSLTEALSQKKDENLLYMGLFLTATLFSLFLFLGGWRYVPALFFSVSTLFFLLDNLWGYLLRTNVLSVTMFYRLNPVSICGNIISLLPINLFILWHLEIPRRKMLAWMFSASSLLRVLALFAFHANFWQLDFAMAIVMFGLIGWQFRRKRIGSGAALTGYGFFLGNALAFELIPLLPFLAFVSRPFVSLAPSSAFLVGMMGSVTLKMREQFRALDALRFRSQRLEAELLKKSIQPHFIMNTLLSIKSFLGSDSAKAEKLIEALAEEFRIINRISAATEIPLHDELKLCRLHLELMGYRRSAQYQLLADGDTHGLLIPPMILHTLIENGLTHAFKPKENGTFRFHCRRERHHTVYRLENDGSNLAGANGSQGPPIVEGMGMRYVRARLEEAFPGKWRLDYGLSQGRWFVQIETEGA